MTAKILLMPITIFVTEKIDYLCSFLSLVIRHQYALPQILIYLRFSIHPSQVTIGVVGNIDGEILFK